VAPEFTPSPVTPEATPTGIQIIAPTRPPTPTPTLSPTPTPTPSPTPLPTLTPTPTFTPTPTLTPTPNPLGEPAFVVDIIDPATIVVQLDGQERRVRYLLLLPPPVDNPAYAQGLELNRALVDDREVFLLADPIAADADAEGRLLRYVFLPDGTFVNLELMQQGYATTDPSISDAAREGELYLAKVQAANSRRGMWAYVTPLSEAVATASVDTGALATARLDTVPVSLASVVGKPAGASGLAQPEGGLTPVANTDALLYAGPGENYPVVGSVRAGQTLVLIAVDPTGLWYQLADGSWICVLFVDNIVVAYPVATAGPTPTPTGAVLIPAVVTPIISLNPTAATTPALTPSTANGGGFSCPNGCVQQPSPTCIIKGEVTSTGERIYYTFASPEYNFIVVQPENGDRYFCSEDEARAAGFRSALESPPTATPTATVVVGPSAEEIDYLNQVVELTGVYSESIGIIGQQVAAAQASPLQIFNETWIVRTAASRAAINVANDRVRQLAAPPRYAALHAEILAVADHYARAMENLTAGVENVDPPRLLQAQQDVAAGNEALGRVRQILTELQVSLSSTAPAPASALPAPAAPTPIPLAPTSAPPTAVVASNCDPSYPGVCIPPPPPNLNCYTEQVPYTNFTVIGSDPHGFDRDNDGIGCEEDDTP
jgi:endonuclease YncB( thermonuclease family)